MEGYLAALRAANVRPALELIHEGNFKQDSGYRLTKALLEVLPPPTALFCTNNLMTVGALQVLRERNVRIPDELSLVGYDDMEWWTLTHPPLTTVGQPVYDLGREAMRLLLAQIGQEKARRPQRVVLKPELILRDSCGPPSRRIHSSLARPSSRIVRSRRNPNDLPDRH